VLVRNSDNEKNLGGKHNNCYNGPMVVVRRRDLNGGYVLAELNGSLSRLRYGAARLVPYLARTSITVDISHLLNMPPDELDALALPDQLEITEDIVDDEP
jgi:hypothetical protein